MTSSEVRSVKVLEAVDLTFRETHIARKRA